MTDSNPDGRRQILNACLKFFTPIARVLLANGIGYREFSEVCRLAFVQTASDEFGVRGRATNASRVSVMTGIPRKEVTKLRMLAGKSGSIPDTVDSTRILSPLADLIHVWTTDVGYLDPSGAPSALNLQGSGERSFQSLVGRCMGDVPVGAVKSELVRLGLVGLCGDGKIRLTSKTLIPEGTKARLESAILYSLCSLASTIAHNNDPRVPESERRFERFVESVPLTSREISELQVVLRGYLTKVTEELDQMIGNETASDEDLERRRIGVGIYYSE